MRELSGATGCSKLGAGAAAAGAILRRRLTISSVSFEERQSVRYIPPTSICAIWFVKTASQVVDKCDVVFAALPHGLSQELAQNACNQRKGFIDLGRFSFEARKNIKNGTAEPIKDKSLHEKGGLRPSGTVPGPDQGKKGDCQSGCIRLGLRWP